LDLPQIESGIVGGGNEGGVDSIYLFANKRLIREDTTLADFKDQQLSIELIIIQSKHEGSFTEAAIQKFRDFADNCLKFEVDLGQAPKILYSEQLLEAVERFHALYKPALRPSLKISFYYATLAERVDAKVETRRGLLVGRLKELYSVAQSSCDFMGASALWHIFNQPSTVPLALRCCKTMAWVEFGKSYVGLVPLGTFYDFIEHGGNPRTSLFESNVRDYHPDAKVNEKIANTLDKPGNEDFWWLNNGITIIASEAMADGDVITVTDALIVNGLQTSYEIFHHFLRASSKEDKRTLLVRIIKTSDPVSIDKIINATNSQTSIPTIWLHATEEIHRRIEVLLQGVGLYYDRRKNYYRNRGKTSQEIVTIPELAQALASIVLQRPHEARGKPTTVAERYYKKLFSAEFPEAVYVKSAQILKRVDSYLDIATLDGVALSRSLRLNLIFYLAMHAVCAVLRSPNPRAKTLAALDVALLTDAVLNASLTIVHQAYVTVGGTDKVAKGNMFVDEVKSSLRSRFGRYPGMPEPRSKQRQK
jgi:hypothetical protein